MQVFDRVLGFVLHGQLTVILRVSAPREVNSWICAPRSTDRDLQRVFAKRKMLGYVSASRQANAWICASRSSDRDLESVSAMKKLMLGYVPRGQPTIILHVSFPIKSGIFKSVISCRLNVS